LFCPTFFNRAGLEYVEKRTSSSPQKSEDIADLDTYERTIIHEFMHVGKFGISEPRGKSTSLVVL
jgi:hypothetical protein